MSEGWSLDTFVRVFEFGDDLAAAGRVLNEMFENCAAVLYGQRDTGFQRLDPRQVTAFDFVASTVHLGEEPVSNVRLFALIDAPDAPSFLDGRTYYVARKDLYQPT